MGRIIGSTAMSVVLLMASGCATKDWVKEHVGQREAALDARVTEQAGQARTRADAAYVRADEVNDRLTRLWNSRHRRALVETLHVQFAFDRWDLTDAAQTALISIVKELRENPNLSVDLEGYADSTGPAAYNVVLSQRRVEAVRRYLVQQGAELPRVHSIGLGPLSGGKTPEDFAKQRRVTVRLMIAAD